MIKGASYFQEQETFFNKYKFLIVGKLVPYRRNTSLQGVLLLEKT